MSFACVTGSCDANILLIGSSAYGNAELPWSSLYGVVSSCDVDDVCSGSSLCGIVFDCADVCSGSSL